MRFNVVVAHYRKPCKVHQIVIPDKHEQSAQRSEGTFSASAKDPESVCNVGWHCDANSVIPQKKSEKVFFRISVVCKIFKNWHSVPSYENCSLATDINL